MNESTQPSLEERKVKALERISISLSCICVIIGMLFLITALASFN